jgi:imidazole glycerol-phosphate synthase subunit HisH
VTVRVVISDLGLGNLRSVERALVRAASLAELDVRVSLSKSPDDLRRADKIVVPGQGGFGACARALGGAGGLGEAIREAIARGTPYFGICLGLQILFARSEEAEGALGLGLFAGEVTRIRAPGLKIPHTGWNVVAPTTTNANALLPRAPTYFYFVHGYVARPTDRDVVAATTTHGEELVAAVAKDNVFACQFHPEKSQQDGLALLGRFLRA